jgi:hypothetical protein
VNGALGLQLLQVRWSKCSLRFLPYARKSFSLQKYVQLLHVN